MEKFIAMSNEEETGKYGKEFIMKHLIQGIKNIAQ